ncbi:MAG: GSCFA domain-containing protein [Verrucomicrobia bacterium]|nr:GSCFA domain-containing protein [Verrucomicrobiota bacterium]
MPIFGASTVFCTMGSCFANELRNALSSRGFHILPRLAREHLSLFSKCSVEVPEWGIWDERVHYQWYNPASLMLEARIAFADSSVPSRSIFPCKKNNQIVFQDPYRRLVFSDSEEQLLRIRRKMDEGVSEAFQHADAFVFTLGLTETWWDKNNDLPLCADPDYGNPDSKPSCYFKNMDYETAFSYVDDLVSLIIAKRGEQIPIFISVSPIPLARTFREVDVVIANTESKSILRSVAGKVSEKFKNVHYFPSFEVCMVDPLTFSEKDGRHVKSKKVDEIIDCFLNCFSKDI